MGKQVRVAAGSAMTLAAFARRIGVAGPQITKAITSGRLTESVGRNKRGQPVILDAELAAKEWRENARRPKGGKTLSLSEWQRRLTAEKTRGQKIANETKLGTLVDVAAVEREQFEAARTVRDSILNVPDRIAAELAAETDEARVHARLETELRLALEAASQKIHGKKRRKS